MRHTAHGLLLESRRSWGSNYLKLVREALVLVQGTGTARRWYVQHVASAFLPGPPLPGGTGLGVLGLPELRHLVAEGPVCRNSGEIGPFAQVCAIIPATRRVGCEKRIVGGILLGPRGHQDLVGTEVAMDATSSRLRKLFRTFEL